MIPDTIKGKRRRVRTNPPPRPTRFTATARPRPRRSSTLTADTVNTTVLTRAVRKRSLASTST